MRILPLRKMLIAGRHCEVGVPVQIDDANAAHAIRMGWAEPAPKRKYTRATEQASGAATDPGDDE